MSEFVQKAQEMALRLISEEMRGAGDTGGAMRRVARKCGVSYSALWALRYRPPSDVFASVYFAIAKTHEAMCDQQARKLEHEIRLREAAGRSDAPLVRAASALAGRETTGSE